MDLENTSKPKRIGKWPLIIGGLILLIIALTITFYLFSNDLSKQPELQITEIQKGNIAAAYTRTSKGFKIKTSEKDFQLFADKFFASKKINSFNISSRSITNNVGTVKATVTADDGAVTPIEYKLVKEDNDWLISGMVIESTSLGVTYSDSSGGSTQVANQNQINTTPISAVKINERFNSEGVVDTNKEIFTPLAPELFVSAYLTQAKAGEMVTALLTYLPTKQTIGPVSNEAVQSGKIISSFSFTKPKTDWQVGNYSMTITLADGYKSVTNFKIE